MYSVVSWHVYHIYWTHTCWWLHCHLSPCCPWWRGPYAPEIKGRLNHTETMVLMKGRTKLIFFFLKEKSDSPLPLPGAFLSTSHKDVMQRLKPFTAFLSPTVYLSHCISVNDTIFCNPYILENVQLISFGKCLTGPTVVGLIMDHTHFELWDWQGCP